MQQIGNFQIGKFDGKNFTVWASSMKDVLVQSGLLEVLEGERPSKTDEAEWKKQERKVVSSIRLCLTDAVKHLVLDETSPVELWKKLEGVYLQKSLANKWVVKKELLQLKMLEGDSLMAHIGAFNKLVQHLAGVDAKLSEEDRVCLLFASMPDSWNPLTNNLLVGKENLNFEDAVASLIQLEKQTQLHRSFGVSSSSSSGGINVIGAEKKKKRSGRVFCFRCDKEGHTVRNCPDLKKAQALRKESPAHIAVAEDSEDEPF